MTLLPFSPPRHLRSVVLLLVMLVSATAGVRAETGYDVWLRYVPVDNPVLQTAYRKSFTSIVVQGRSLTLDIIAAELERASKGLLGTQSPRADAVTADGAIVAGTPASSALIAALGWQASLKQLGDEG